MDQSYLMYCFYCHNNGDIWAEYYRPYTYEEWLENGKPEHPGKNDEFCKSIKPRV
jgi:hypothetical protein